MVLWKIRRVLSAGKRVIVFPGLLVIYLLMISIHSYCQDSVICVISMPLASIVGFIFGYFPGIILSLLLAATDILYSHDFSQRTLEFFQLDSIIHISNLVTVLLFSETGKMYRLILKNSSEMKTRGEEASRVNSELEEAIATKTRELIEINSRLNEKIREDRLIKEELQYRVEVEELISGISSEFTNIAVEEIPERIKKACRQITFFINADHGCILQVSGNSISSNCTSEYCNCESDNTGLAGFPLAGVVDYFLNSSAVTVNIRRLEEAEVENLKIQRCLEQYRVTSLLIIPIKDNNAVSGAFCFLTIDREVLWNESDIRLLRIMGEIFVNAIARGKAKKRLIGKIEELEAVYCLTDRINRFESIEMIMEEALNCLDRTLSSDKSSILLCDNYGTMRFRSWRNLSDNYRSEVEGHSPWQKDVINPEAIFMTEITPDNIPDNIWYALKTEGISSMAFIPLLSRGKLMGKFMIYYTSKREFTEDDRRIAQIIARQVSFAIQRLKDEEEIKSEKNKFIAFMDHFPGIAFINDLDNNPVYLNRHALELTSSRQQDNKIRSDDSEDDSVPDNLEIIPGMYLEEDHQKTNISGVPSRTITVTGEESNKQYWHLTRFPVKYSSRDYYGGIAINITERRLAEEKLRQSENFYHQLFLTAHEPILLINPEDEIVLEANERACHVYGYSSEEFLGMSLKLLSRDVARGEEKIRETLKSGSFLSFETVQSGKNGRDIHFEVNASTIMYNGKTAILSINRDVTEKKIAEAELNEYRVHLEKLVNTRTADLKEANDQLSWLIEKERHSERKLQMQYNFLRVLIDTIPIPIFIKDRGLMIKDCNAAFLEFFGVSREEAVGKPGYSFSPSLLMELHARMDEELFIHPSSSTYEGFAFNRKGEKRDLVINKATITNYEGEIDGLVVILFDITERKKLETELAISLQNEKELSGLKSRFISTASHEFRTPLTAILSAADLLESFGRNWSEEKYQSQIKIIQDEVNTLTETISDILTISRIDTGITEFQTGEVDLYHLCVNLLAEIKANFKKRVNVTLNYDAGTSRMRMDKRLLRQIILNLLSNAIKYSFENGQIIFNVLKVDENIRIIVKDEGIGIEDQDKEKVFVPFFRGRNANNLQGTGLGLSIVRKSVELHNGTITFSSSPGKGTIFEVTLPLK